MNDTLYALDVERSVLGAILFNPEILVDVSEIISKSDFYSKDHGDIFEAMVALRDKNEPIDDKFITKELGTRLKPAVLNEIMASSGVVDVIKYAKFLKEISQKRGLLGIAQSVPQIINEKPLNDAIDEISSKLYALNQDDNQNSIKTGKEAAKLAIEEILQRKADGGGLLGISSGYTDIDTKTSGLKNGDFVIIAARPGMGKTTFALNIVEKVLDNGVGAVFFSLEMPSWQLMSRMFSSLGSIELNRIFTGVSLNDTELEMLSAVCERISSYDFFIYDGRDLSVHKVRSELRKLKEKHPSIGLCVIDYIGLMTNSSSFSERHLQIAEISRSLKLLAREMRMPIIALSQLNRGLESRANKKPMLSDLRESGSLEQDADTILFVYREDVYKEQEAKERQAAAAAAGKAESVGFKANSDIENAKIIIGKNRHGPTGEIDMVFHKKFSHFSGVMKDIEPAQIHEPEE